MSTDLLSQFKFLINENKGSKLENIIQNILESSLINIEELFTLPNIQELATKENLHYNTIKLFSRENYFTYKKNTKSYISLSGDVLNKLKMITLIDLAKDNKTLHYKDLMKDLDFKNQFELDSVLFNSFTQGVISGKIDHQNQIVKILSVKARDNSTNSKIALDRLTKWLNNIEKAEKFLDKEINTLRNDTSTLYDNINIKVDTIQNLVDNEIKKKI